MKKISLGIGAVLLASVFVCGMSKRAQNMPAVAAESTSVSAETAPIVAVKKSVAKDVPVQLRGYLLANLPQAMAEIVSANDRVDVLTTFSALMKDGTRQKVTVTLLQNVKVLKVGTIENKAKVGTVENKAYVVLALSPRDSQYMALSEQEGEIAVIVRPTGDEAQYIMEISTLEKLFQ